VGSQGSLHLGFEAINGEEFNEDAPSFYNWFLLLVVEVLPVTLSLSLLLLRSIGQCYLAVAHVLSLPIQSVFATNPSYTPPISDVDTLQGVTNSNFMQWKH